jgi:arabinofuranan 3-O-arabinosyltransferase
LNIFTFPQPPKIILIPLIVIICLALFTFIAIQLTAGEPLFDFTAFWIAGKLTLSGGDPYLKNDWIPLYEPFNLGLADNQTFLYPKPILPLFLPFGLLPLRTAAVFWLVLTQSAVVGAILLLSRFWLDRRAALFLPFIFSVFIFRSYLVTLTLGQLDGLLVLLLAGVAILWDKKRWFWGGLLFSLMALKPSLGLPLILLASIWFLKDRIWEHFVGMGIGGISMLAVGWLFDPGWVGKFIEIGTNKVAQTFGYHPTLWGLAGYLCGRQDNCTYLAGGLTTAVFAVLFLWLILQKKFVLTLTMMLSASIIFSLLLTPYLWIYDQLLLIIPLAILVGKKNQQNQPYLVSALLPILVSVVSLALLPVAVQIRNDVWNVLVPLLVLAIFFFTFTKPDTITIEN